MSTTGIASVPKVTSKSRSHALDLVRLIGIVAIVAGHSSGSPWLAHWVFSWHVPVFFVISGYLWSPDRSTRVELVKRTRSLLVPYVSWIVVVSVIWFAFLLVIGDDIDWSKSAKDLLMGGWHIYRPYSAFWFVTALFLATVAMRWLSNVSAFLPWFVGAVGMAWCIVDPNAAKKVPESAALALAAILFLCVGTLLRRYRSQILEPMKFGLALLVPALLLGASPGVDVFNMKNGDLGTPILGVFIGAAISCGLILVCEAVGPSIPAGLGRAISSLAQTGIPIILSHALVLAIAARLGMDSAKLMFLLALFIPLAVAFWLRGTRLSRYFM